MLVGVVGLGELGGPLALHLAEHFDVVISDRDQDRVERLLAEGEGSRLSDDPRRVWQAGVVLCLLPDSDVTLAVLRAAAAGGLSGVVVVDLSSGDPGSATSLAEVVSGAGGQYLAATVLNGGGTEAREGRFQLAVGGPPAAIAAARVVLDEVGAIAAEFDTAEKAQTLKLVNNYLSLATIALLAEAITVAERGGIQRADALAYLASGTANNWVGLAAAGRVAAKADGPEGPAGFRAALAAKDLRYLIRTAERTGAEGLIAAAVRQIYAEAEAAGKGAAEAGTWPWRRLRRREAER